MQSTQLLSRLTRAQKVALLSGKDMWTTWPVPSLGIPSLRLSDGPHGVRCQAGEGDHLGLNDSLPATCFPTAATLANSWDAALLQQVGAAIGQEAVSQQVNVLLGPGVNLKRSPLGGRNFEYYSEDPYLTGKLAAGFVQGVQVNGISACPKHFAANSQEWYRMCSDSLVDERTLRELYLTAFEILVKEAHPRVMMSSYNKVNSTYASENRKLLTDILRGEWGFDGMVVTDWGGTSDRVQSLLAGNTLEMPGVYGDSDPEVLQALAEGTLPEEVLDQRVEELLQVVFATQQPNSTGPRSFDAKAHHALARQAAAASIVLLKNDRKILPLTPGTKVAVIGDFARTPRYQGAGSSQIHPTEVDTPLAMLRQSPLQVVAEAQGYQRDGSPDAALIQEAQAAARQAQVTLVYLGLPENAESEGMDRQGLALPENQNQLMQALAQVTDQIVVVLAGGGPVELPWLAQCQALLACYLCGQAGAGAMVDVLTGKVNPSGKLAETWPVRLADTPAAAYFPGRARTAEYREGPFVGYRFTETAQLPPQFCFGYGLSYTRFSYTDLTLDEAGAHFTLTNTGRCPGAEIAQLYLSKPDSPLPRPARELKGFAKVYLHPGEQRRVTIPFDDYSFRYYAVDSHSWQVEAGAYTVAIGASVQDLRLTGSIVQQGVQPDPGQLLPECYRSGRVQQVSAEDFSVLLGHPLPPADWDKTAPLAWNEPLSRLTQARSRIMRWMGRKLEANYQQSLTGKLPDMNILFAYNMPFRAIGKITNGMAGSRAARAVLQAANGQFFRGLGHACAELHRRKAACAERRKGIDG